MSDAKQASMTLLFVCLMGVWFTYAENENGTSCAQLRYGRNCRLKCKCKYEEECMTNMTSCTVCKNGFERIFSMCHERNVIHFGTIRSDSNSAPSPSILTGNRPESCSTFENWFEVDLGQDYYVRSAALDYRTSAGFKLYISNVTRDEAEDRYCIEFPGKDFVQPENLAFDCPKSMYGRYLHFVINGSSFEVCHLWLGATECVDFTYGKRCQNECRCLDPMEICDKSTGDCPSGCYMGNKSKAECFTTTASPTTTKLPPSTVTKISHTTVRNTTSKSSTTIQKMSSNPARNTTRKSSTTVQEMSSNPTGPTVSIFSIPPVESMPPTEQSSFQSKSTTRETTISTIDPNDVIHQGDGVIPGYLIASLSVVAVVLLAVALVVFKKFLDRRNKQKDVTKTLLKEDDLLSLTKTKRSVMTEKSGNSRKASSAIGSKL